MKPISSDIEWLRRFQPDLTYDREKNSITGELSFCACFDELTRKINIEGSERDETIRARPNFISDFFDIDIELDTETQRYARWPLVREIGGRKDEIAGRLQIPSDDLHFYSGSDVCCLGISYSADPTLTVERFIVELVIPFFYRLSFVDRFGLVAASKELWDEYSHGDPGLTQYDAAMGEIAEQNLGVNDRCACASGKKFKNCCKREVAAWLRARRPQPPLPLTPKQ